MADSEHIKVFKQGVEVWNQWRTENPRIKPVLNGLDLRGSRLDHFDLSSTNLSGANLKGTVLADADLSFANLNGACLDEADLSRAILTDSTLRGTQLHRTRLFNADLSRARLNEARLIGADLSHANFKGTDLKQADLTSAILREAYLRDTDLVGATLCRTDLRRAMFEGVNLAEADLTEANLIGAMLHVISLNGAKLKGTNLHNAHVSRVNFTGVNISEIEDLATVIHEGPSEVSVSTISLSHGKIPEVFLRGCGLGDWQIQTVKLYQSNLSNEEITNILYRVHDLRATQAIQINPLFISYNHKDSSFVDEMAEYLNAKGIRFWRDIHHAIAGRLERQIDRAIRLNPTVLVILSANSTQSDWVEHEVRMARKLEIETHRDVLCPIALDDSWKDCKWPERLREQIMEYNILDFSHWNIEDNFRRMFSRLIEGLDLFYK